MPNTQKNGIMAQYDKWPIALINVTEIYSHAAGFAFHEPCVGKSVPEKGVAIKEVRILGLPVVRILKCQNVKVVMVMGVPVYLQNPQVPIL